MGNLVFTPEQRRAIETIDRSVLVSAAAGSGKTAVLAERAAHLVCDAPPEQRCDIDQLVVVTFTENAAAEMRARIRETIHARLRRRPQDARLREQLALIDHARISTLHAFGLWMLRRWFSQAGVDPAAPVLDAHEAALLRSETLERLFEGLYADESEPGADFRKLINDYGLGGDLEIRRFLERLAAFLESLPDPQDWLTRCLDLVTADRHRLLEQLAVDLAEELTGQADYCRRAARHIEGHLSDFMFYGQLLAEAAELLEAWLAELRGTSGVGRASPVAEAYRAVDDQAGETCPIRFAGVQAAIGAHEFHAKGAPQVPKDAPAERHARREQARQLYTHFHERLFQNRLQRLYGRFTPEEWFAGLDRIGPYVRTVTQLVERYRRDYAQAKADAGVLDFADLERKSYDLLVQHAEVAAALRQRFHYVLVDEFQDINPLQEAIIRLASREADDDLPDNLFVVGDVKQSIYRFRLAEPDIFLARQAALDAQETPGACVYLQRNYRSAAHILDAVNHLFRRLLTRHVGGIEYDASAELRPGHQPEAAGGGPAPSVELHLLQRRWTTQNDADTGLVDLNDPAEWSAIEREAYVIAQRIRQIIDAGVARRDGTPVGYGDVAVLLRAAAHTAAPMAQRLGALGIPACADVGGEFFNAVEVRDILSLLSVLDNPRQDIPLAAALRSPVLGDALNEDELLALRMIDRDIPFHETVRKYAAAGPDPALRERVARVVGRLERHRDEARQRPLSETLWRIYHAHGYLAYVGGLPNAAGRRANLLTLHEYARRFGTFQKQGLHRFLRFLETLEEQGQDLDTTPSPAPAEGVVRVMSIHRSKGLEFPVVIVADLGRRFNLSDAAGRLLFDRRWGLGVRVVDRDRMIEYPSLTHQLVAGCVNHHTRAEELRILYVAMTRAMERLILVGSADLPTLRRDYALHLGADGPLSRLAIGMAATPLDWLVPALATLPHGAVRWYTPADRDPYAEVPEPRTSVRAVVPAPGAAPRRGDEDQVTGVAPAVFSVHTYSEEEMSGWTLEVSASRSEKPTRRAAAELRPLPPEEPIDAPEAEVAPVLARLSYVYPHLAAASVPAIVAATEIRKRYDWLRDPDERPAVISPERLEGAPVGATAGGPKRARAVGRTPAAEAGLITHRVLQHLAWQVKPEPEALRDELQRLVRGGLLDPVEVQAVDLEAVAWFLGTELGIRIRGSGADYRREVMFVHRQPARVIDPLMGGGDAPRGMNPATREREARGTEDELGDNVLVRGVIDGVLVCGHGVEIVDYKTDHIPAAAVDERARAYAPQLAAYAAAAEALFRRPTEKWWLVFLHPRTIVDARGAR